MLRRVLIFCMVVSMLVVVPGTTAFAHLVHFIDFEIINGVPGYVNMPVSVVQCPQLTVTFSSTNPLMPDPSLGDWCGPAGEAWLCNALGVQDVTIPMPSYAQCGEFFLTWVANDPIAYDLVVDFSVPVESFEGDVFDIDLTGEVLTITAYDAYGVVVGTPMTVDPNNPAGGGDCGLQHWSVQGKGIRKVVFDGYKPTDNFGFAIDQLMITYMYPVECCTDFDDNNKHGFGSWKPNGVAVTLENGGPAGSVKYLHAVDKYSPPTSAVSAGEDCFATLEAICATGYGDFCWDMRVFDDKGNNIPRSVQIYGGPTGTYRAAWVSNDPAIGVDGQWHTICAAIGPREPNGDLPSNSTGYWKMVDPLNDNPKWDDIIASVTDIVFPFDYTAGYEEIGIDNVCTRGGVEDVGPIPTLSEWGAIIFGILLLGSVAFYIRRRRRVKIA